MPSMRDGIHGISWLRIGLGTRLGISQISDQRTQVHGGEYFNLTVFFIFGGFAHHFLCGCTDTKLRVCLRTHRKTFVRRSRAFFAISDILKSPGPYENLSSPLESIPPDKNKNPVHPAQVQKFSENFESSPVHMDWPDGLVWTSKKTNPLVANSSSLVLGKTASSYLN